MIVIVPLIVAESFFEALPLFIFSVEAPFWESLLILPSDTCGGLRCFSGRRFIGFIMSANLAIFANSEALVCLLISHISSSYVSSIIWKEKSIFSKVFLIISKMENTYTETSRLFLSLLSLGYSRYSCRQADRYYKSLVIASYSWCFSTSISERDSMTICSYLFNASRSSLNSLLMIPISHYECDDNSF